MLQEEISDSDETKQISLPASKINTGTQTPHKTSIKKPNIPNTKMNVDLNVLIKFINKFDGSREKLTPFINNCKNALSLSSPPQTDILFKYILSQLEGRAESACSIKDFDNWLQLEEFLKSQFGERKHYAALLTDLQSCRQEIGDSVSQFALKVESCLSKLLTEINVSIPTKKKGELAGRVAAMEDLAIHTFTVGLAPRLSTVVRCRDPETLNEAINIAISEEKITQAVDKRNTNNNKFNNNNYNRYNKFNSFNKLPSNRPKFEQFRPVHVTSQYQNPSSSRNPSEPICRYCKFTGHTIENCRKREYNNNRFKNSQTHRPSQFVNHIDSHIDSLDTEETQVQETLN